MCVKQILNIPKKGDFLFIYLTVNMLTFMISLFRASKFKKMWRCSKNWTQPQRKADQAVHGTAAKLHQLFKHLCCRFQRIWIKTKSILHVPGFNFPRSSLLLKENSVKAYYWADSIVSQHISILPTEFRHFVYAWCFLENALYLILRLSSAGKNNSIDVCLNSLRQPVCEFSAKAVKWFTSK